MEAIRRAFDNDAFAFHGKHFDFPPPGIPDRGGTVQELTLVPRPLYPYEIWQAVTSPPTLDYVPRKGWGGVFWLKQHDRIAQDWDRFAEIYEREHGVGLAAGDKRMLVLNIRIEDTHEKAWATARAGHDEFWKFLGPYGWSRGYMGADGKPAKPGLIPTLEESIEQKTILVGTPEEVAAGVQSFRDLMGVENITIFPHLIGDPYEKAVEQMARFVTDVTPLL
jgi:alkanesulfonate monooxygenase SsuD/methylene tetrahydromethanopterin reductase-like flavin-dependent oxidoreductase (luciferase family)